MPNDNRTEMTSERSSVSDKRYAKPTLTEYGPVAALTQAGTSLGAEMGGGGGMGSMGGDMAAGSRRP